MINARSIDIRQVTEIRGLTGQIQIATDDTVIVSFLPGIQTYNLVASLQHTSKTKQLFLSILGCLLQ
ncbi:hypothetical protein AC626_02855 [Pseudoalteromonas rubra]|uniref:Uncharacterized protein n=1 Tax=Pseudoalteromonas rubra TaxID=43658 RepID=A0A0L0EY79_9GAMM|nr:hypothetical protein AC626_02855 [Pseudoalteromonas rubra]